MSDETSIRQNIELWAKHYNDHDAAELAAWYGLESVFIAPTGVALVGPEQIHGYFRASFQRSPQTGIRVHTTEVRMEKPDLAIARGTFEVTRAIAPDGEPLEMRGPWVSAFARQGDAWVPLSHASAITLEAYTPMVV